MDKIAIVLLAFSIPTFANNQSPNKKSLLVSVDLQLKDTHKALNIKNKLTISKENNTWTPLAPAVEGVALLGKLENIGDGIIMANFMVVDTSTTPVGLKQLDVAAQLGKAAKVASLTEGDGITVNLLAEETTYQEK
jgi:hypothetical protein